MTPYIKHLVSLIEGELGALDVHGNPPELYEPIRYILGLGGKRLRPLFTLLSYNLFRPDPESIVRIANLVEIFHNFTLMHDDIMDHAPLRRGKSTVHEKWNPNIGILSGDRMMVKAYELLESVEEKQLRACFTAFNHCAAEVCEGQQVDMNFEKIPQVSESAYLQMIHQKTAVLLGFSMELGAILARADHHQTILVKEFGINIGMGFQLKDDLLDIYGDQSKFGKQVGGDIIANKKTYLLTKALELANASQHEELKSWMMQKEFDNSEKVKAITDIYDQLGIKEQTEEKINCYFQRAYEAIEGLDVNPDHLKELRSYADYLTHRER